MDCWRFAQWRGGPEPPDERWPGLDLTQISNLNSTNEPFGGGRPSNGSRKASRRRIGPGYRVIDSERMKHAYS